MLVRGEGEPVYRPWTAERPTAEVVFAHGFPSSALHEVAHWCIAGRERRKLQDFGYWYHPDGRSMDQQRLFESVEVKPQALEWIFSVAAGLDFHFSADNLAEGGAESTPAWEAFQDAVARQARTYVVQGLPPRARLFASRLSEAFATGGSWMNPASYARAAL